jgi:hypothetical protein
MAMPGGPEDVLAVLVELAQSSVNKQLHCDDVSRAIEEPGRRRRDWANDPHKSSSMTLRVTR